MKTKMTPPKRKRLAKIAEATTMRDKLLLAHYGMTAKEYSSPEMMMARKFFWTRHVDGKELQQRVKRELKNSAVTARTETEFAALKSGQKELLQYAWTAVREWQPEMFLRLAWAMQKIARHKFPDSHDGWRRAYLVGCNGNVADAVKAIHWPCDPDLERDKLNRLKKRLFP